MFNSIRLLTFVTMALALTTSSVAVFAQDEPCAAEGKSTTIADAFLYVEYNSTDGDLGVHGLFDDHGWSELCVYDPNGVQVLWVKPDAQLGDQGIAGIFFESREPILDEFGFEELAASFPEGSTQCAASTTMAPS